MTEITQCPECGTRFKVTAAQLAAHDGMVRCGRCHEVFNALDHLHDDEPNPQLSLPIDSDDSESAATLQNSLNTDDQVSAPATLAQQVRFVEELTDEVPVPRKLPWVGIVAVPLLTLTLVAQAAYFFRVELAARMPGLKPALEEYCSLLACNVSLPQRSDLMVIESSELASDPKLGNIITLHALINNRAPYAQAYPNIELTLTDVQDQALARRIFRPADYLKDRASEAHGAPANRDLDIQLHMDTTDLKPAGYRLFLFHPKQPNA